MLNQDKFSDVISVTDVKLVQRDEYQQLSATVDGETIWYRFPLWLDIEPRAEIFLAPAMFEAMARGGAVRIEGSVPISEKLYNSFDELQSLFRSWNPEIPKVTLEAKTQSHISQNDMVISCFSGGIDSMHTFSCHRQEISHLLLLQGFDGHENLEGWQENKAARQAFADQHNKKLIIVESNVTAFLWDRKISWNIGHGCVLNGIATTLSARKFYVPSSYSYVNLFPWGSHPLIDRCCDTESTEIIHHGLGTNRSEKAEVIAQYQDLLDELQVCWQSSGSNCGECSKCVRTALVIYIMGKHSKNLPAFNDMSKLSLLKPYDVASLPIIDYIILFALKYHALDIAKTLKSYRRWFLIKSSFVEFLKMLTGMWGRKLARKLRRRGWQDMRLLLSPRDSKLD